MPQPFNMQENRINILSTRPLPDSLVQEAGHAGIRLEQVDFIQTEPIRSVEVQQEIEQALLKSATVVFTSMNAVEAVAAELYDLQPDWNIYCIGNTTRQLVARYFGEEKITGTAASAGELARLIAETSDAEEVIFFCGDQRRRELPEILDSHDILVNEIVVYQTIAVPQKLEEEYNGILFFSPSAVDSFFRVNKAGEKTIFFAIGQTTAAQIRKYSGNRVVVSDEPGKETLLATAIEFFT